MRHIRDSGAREKSIETARATEHVWCGLELTLRCVFNWKPTPQAVVDKLIGLFHWKTALLGLMQ